MYLYRLTCLSNSSSCLTTSVKGNSIKTNIEPPSLLVHLYRALINLFLIIGGGGCTIPKIKNEHNVPVS